jgi:hypothetical protein
MEPEGLLPCTQGPITDPYPESDDSSPNPHRISHNFILNLFDII